MSAITESIDALAHYYADPAMIAIIHKKLMEIGIPIKQSRNLAAPCPADIFAAEYSIFDNSARLVNANDNRRYNSTLKVWASGEDFSFGDPAFRANAALRDAEDMVKTAKKAVISDALRADVTAVAAGLGAADRMGLLATKAYGAGTHYHDQHLMILMDARLADRHVGKALLYVDGSTVDLGRFATTDAKGKPLTGNCILQARYCPSGALGSWSTDGAAS